FATCGVSVPSMQGETIPAKRFARLSGALRASLGLVLDVALPQLCPTCREPVDGAGLCPACWSKLSFIAPPYCERLGIPFPCDGGRGLWSMEAIADPPAYHRARAAVRYDDIARKLVHALKYGDRLDLAPAMGRWMARAGHELLTDTDAIVAVPLHWRRQWARRFNQSALLAEIIAKASGGTVAHGALKRVQGAPQQGGPDQAERAPNGQGAFRLPCHGPTGGAGPWPSRGDGTKAGAGRRRAHVRRDRRRLRAGIVARGRGVRRRPGIRPGCGGEPLSHIRIRKTRDSSWLRSRFTPPATAHIAT